MFTLTLYFTVGWAFCVIDYFLYSRELSDITVTFIMGRIFILILWPFFVIGFIILLFTGDITREMLKPKDNNDN